MSEDFVEDKILAQAKAESKDPFEIARTYEKRFHTDLKTLNISPADSYPKASECIDLMHDLIAQLIESNNALAFNVGSSYTERMRIDTSGNLLVGTTSAASKLTVASEMSLVTDNNNRGIIGWDNSLKRLSFGTINAGTAYFDSVSLRDGNLLVGATSTGNAHILQTATSGVYSTQFISSTASSPFGSNINFSGATPNGTSNQFLYCNDSSALRMEVRSNGGLANYSANNVNLSDRREKTNFAPATSYLDKICAIPVQTFNYIDQNLEEDGGLTLGVVAQDVQAVAPELVMESNWAKQGDEPKMRLSIYQTDLQYALMKCIQEQQATIESLKARLDAANL